MTTAAYLREAAADDAEVLWQWAVDPDVLTFGFEPCAFDRPAFSAWLGRILGNGDCLAALLILEDGRAAGQIRFERVDGGLEVDLSVDAALRGKGWGRELMRLGLQEARRRWPAGTRVIATVRAENERSHRLFRSSGFQPEEAGVTDGKAYTQWMITL